MRLSLRLAIIFSFYGIVIAGGFQYLYVLSLRKQFYQEATAMADSEEKAVQLLIQKKVARKDWNGLQKNLGEMIRQTGIASIWIVDFSGRRIVGRADHRQWMTRAFHFGLPMTKCRDGFYDLETPILIGRHRWGKLAVSFHTTILEERLHKLEANVVGSGVTAFLAITLLAWLIGAWFGSRIERLVPRIEALAKDPENFKPMKTDGKIKDEAGRLALAFNSLGASLRKEMRRRRELEEEKAELSAMLVHDLKSPLTVIRSGVTFLKEQIGTADSSIKTRKEISGSEKTFKLLNSSLERLHRMVEDVLQLSRMEEIPDLPESSPVDLSAMIHVAGKDFELVARARGEIIRVKPNPEQTPPVLGDPILLRRVLDNLIYNAIEHTPAQGEIELSVERDARGIRVNVRDTGAGIPEDARQDIFKKFFQKGMKRHVGNVGLGLALCEKVILRHGGIIGVEDAKPKGACFYFILPLA